MNDSIVGIIPNSQLKQGIFKSTSYTLIVTKTYLILAEITKDLLKSAASQAKKESQDNGEGFIKRMWNVGTSGYNFHLRYNEMSIDDILNETANNFTIPLSSIEKIKWKHGDQVETNIPDKMVLKTNVDKYTFILKGSSVNEAKKIFQQSIPDRV